MSKPLEERGTTTEGLDRLFNEASTTEQSKIDAAEQGIRARATWLIASGATVVLLVVGLAILWHVGFGDAMPAVYVIPLYAVGFGSIFLGAMEIMFRSYRIAQTGVGERIDRIEHGMRLLVHMLPDEFQQRWYAGYGRGHEDGRNYRTGTTDTPGQRVTGDVLRLRRRNDPRTR